MNCHKTMAAAKHAIVFISALLPAAIAVQQAAEPARPSVVLVVFDDLNNRLGCYGDPIAKSGAISELIDIFRTLADMSGHPSLPQFVGTSLVHVLEDAGATVKTAALTQHPRPALDRGGGSHVLPQVMGYGLTIDRWGYHEWRDFKAGYIVGQELCNEQTDLLETVNQAETVGAAAVSQISLDNLMR